MIAIASPSSALFRRLFLPFASTIIRFVRVALGIRVCYLYYSFKFLVEDWYEKKLQESGTSIRMIQNQVKGFFKLYKWLKY